MATSPHKVKRVGSPNKGAKVAKRSGSAQKKVKISPKKLAAHKANEKNAAKAHVEEGLKHFRHSEKTLGDRRRESAGMEKKKHGSKLAGMKGTSRVAAGLTASPKKGGGKKKPQKMAAAAKNRKSSHKK
jgi:hypothetical protein